MQDGPSPPRVVVLFNRTSDTLLMLRVALEHAGFAAYPVLIGADADAQQLEAAVSRERPDVVVYDVAPPYEPEWRLLQEVKRTGSLARCYFVVTSTNRAQLQRLAAPDPQIFAVFGTPYDLKEIVEAIRVALAAGPYEGGGGGHGG